MVVREYYNLVQRWLSVSHIILCLLFCISQLSGQIVEAPADRILSIEHTIPSCFQEGGHSTFFIVIFDSHIKNNTAESLRVSQNGKTILDQDVSYTGGESYQAELSTTIASSANFLIEYLDKTGEPLISEEVMVSAIPDIQASVKQMSCPDKPSASIEIMNDALQSVSWSNGVFGSSLLNVGPGSYTATMTTDQGCVIERTYQILPPKAIQMEFQKVRFECDGFSDDLLIMKTTPSSDAVQYDWAIDGLGDWDDPNMVAIGEDDVYNLQVKFGEGCVFNRQVNVKNIPATPFTASDTELMSSKQVNGDWYEFDLNLALDLKHGDIDNDASNGSIYNVSFHASEVEADLSINPISETYVSQPTTIYARVQSPTSCYQTSSVVLTSVQPLEVTLRLAQDEVCDHEGPFRLTGGSPAGGSYSVIQCSQGTPCPVSPISLDPTTGDYLFDPTVGEGIYTVEYTVIDDTGLPSSAIDLVAVQAFNFDFFVAASTICSNSGKIEIATVPTGQIITGIGVTSEIQVVNGIDREIYYFDPSGLTPGTYDITSDYTFTSTTSGYVCSDVIMKQVEIFDIPTFTLSQNEIQACAGETVTVTSSISGGAVTPTYFWSGPNNFSSAEPSLTLADMTSAQSGIYSLTVISENGCRSVEAVDIDIRDQPILSCEPVSMVSCFGERDGAATVTVINPQGEYQYAWPNGLTESAATGLSAGDYTITVTDMNGCASSCDVTIESPDLLTLDVEIDQTVSCFGGSDGQATATIMGGTGPYTITWDDLPGQTTNSALTSGIKNIKVIDAAGCEAMQSINISSPPVLECTIINTVDVGCHGESTGAANVTVQGGTPGYTFLWDNDEEVLNARMLNAATHTLTITDANECTTTCQVVINQPDPIRINTTLRSQVSCNQSIDGSAEATVTGGAGTYSYLWDNSETSSTAVSLSAGLHTVTVTDQNACQDSSTINITQPNPLVVTVVSRIDATCFNESNGAATIAISGGSPAYSILWSNGQNTTSVSSLAAGDHRVTVTDAAGCIEIVEITIEQPPFLSAQPSVSRPISCFGEKDGSATMAVSGGIAPYSILWPNEETGTDATRLAGGSHTVTITDSNNCSIEAQLFLNEPPELSINMNIAVPVMCHGESTGSADVTSTGGTPPYQYTWDNGVTERFNPMLAAGERFVTVTDASGCMVSASVMIDEPAAAEVSIADLRPHLCGDVPSGQATIVVDGPSTYTFAWNNGEIGPTAFRLGEGDHVVSITDAAGCQLVQEVNIDMISSMICETEQLLASSCQGKADGSARVTVLNGIQVKSYLWDSGETTAQADQLTPGTHTVTITDANDCTSTCEVEIELLDPLVLACNKQVNYSLGPDCQLNFYPDLVLENFSRDFDYNLILTDQDGEVIDTNDLSIYINENLSYTIQDACNGNTCGGRIKIEDKLGPVLECSTRHEDCMSLYDFDRYQLPVAEAKSVTRLSKHEFSIVSDADCSAFTLSFVDALVEGDCDDEFLYEVQRVWTATDAYGNVSECTEEIHVSEAELSIHWPKDTLVYGCMDMDKALIKEDASHPLSIQWMGRPHYAGLDSLDKYHHSICSELYPAYSDDIVELCTGSYKILRTWDIVKDCSSTQEQKTQVIYVQSAFPELVQRDTIVKINSGVKCAVDITLRPNLSDYCGQVDQVSGKIYHESEMEYCLPYEEKLLADPITFRNGEIIIPEVQAGCNFIELYVQSDCHHVDTLQFHVTVEDYLAPVVVCDQAATVVLGSDGLGYLAPENVDNGSWDNCGISQMVLVKQDSLCEIDSLSTLEDKLAFCCAEIGQSVIVALVVTDLEGNESSCKVNVTIAENEYPTIECPDNLIIPCNSDFDDLEITGRPWASSACSDYEFIYQDSTKHNQCRNQLIKRKWYLVRSQDTSFVCLQDIQLYNENPFTEKYIQWPNDTIIENCYADITPEVLGSPIIDTLSSCSLIASNYFDKEFSLSLESCRSVVREWTIIDWCQYDDERGSWKKSQIIKIHDNIAPELSCEDMTVCAADRDCSSSVDVYSSASDNCSDLVGLSFEYRLSLYGATSADSVYQERSSSHSMVLPVGEHELFTIVSDQCGNTADCYRKISVTDCKAPTPYCIGQTATTILDADDHVEIWAVDFNLASSDNCTPDEGLQFSFEEDSIVSSLSIDCDAIVSNGGYDFRVGVWVSDEAGNADVCYVNIEIAQRDGSGCDLTDVGSSSLIISGMVSLMSGVGLSDVELQIKDAHQDVNAQSIEIDEGFFEMSQANADHQYRLEFSKSGDYLGGLSTIDLIQIQNHILNLRPFADPYKSVAADVNNDGKVTSIDLVLLKQLIIGQREDLPAFESAWKFLYDGDLPAVRNMDDATIGIADMSEDVFVDVKAIKMGDVNGSYADLQRHESRSDKRINISAADTDFDTGQAIEVALESEEAFVAQGLQLFLTIDSDVLEFQDASWNGMALSSGEVYYDEGALHFNVLRQEIDLSSDRLVLRFKAIDSGRISESIELKEAHLPNEIISQSGDFRAIDLSFISTDGTAQSLDFTSVYPNPFIQDATLSFRLKQAGAVSLSIVQSDGRMIHSEQLQMTAGANALRLRDLQAKLRPGMYYIILESGGEKHSQTVVKIAP